MMNFFRRQLNRQRNKGGKAGAPLPDGTFPDAALREAAPAYIVETKPAGTTLAHNPPTGITPAGMNPADTQKSLTSSPATQTCHVHHCMPQHVTSPRSTFLPIQREENQESDDCCNTYLTGLNSKVLNRQAHWFRGKEDFDLVTPQHGTSPREHASQRTGIVIGNNLQQKMEVNVMGKVVVCPLAVENELREAALNNPELWEFWLKLRHGVKKWIPYIAAERITHYDEEKKNDIRFFEAIELLCQHVHWHCERGCCKTRDWKGVLTKATLSLCDLKVRLEGTGRETFGGAYFSATILVSDLLDHVKTVRRRPPKEILDWWTNGADVSEVLN